MSNPGSIFIYECVGGHVKVNTGYIPSLFHVINQDEMGQLCSLKKYDLDNIDFSFCLPKPSVWRSPPRYQY